LAGHEKEAPTKIKKAENDPSPEVYAEFELFDSAEWLEKLRRRTRDALNKTASEKDIVGCAIKLDVKLE